jgi:ABC-type sugar transport system ATPase subunit
MVFQSYALYPHMTVRRNLAFALEVRKTAKEEIERRVAEAAEMLGLVDLLDRYPRQLSGGQRQRVAMGRAIVRRPKVFLFDEPLSNLDASLRSLMRVELARLHRKLGVTMIYVTHDQVEAMTLADRIVVLHEGVVQQVGSPRELYDRPRNRFVAAFIGSPSMNFIPATLVVDGDRFRATGDSFELELDPTRIQAPVGEDDEIILGIRPHDFRLGAVGSGGFEVTVDVVEPMGWESFVYATFGDSTFVVHSEAEPASRLEPGSDVGLGAAPELVHVFDAATGRSLAWS